MSAMTHLWSLCFRKALWLLSDLHSQEPTVCGMVKVKQDHSLDNMGTEACGATMVPACASRRPHLWRR